MLSRSEAVWARLTELSFIGLFIVASILLLSIFIYIVDWIGIRALTDAVSSAEVLFAIRLSIATSSVSAAAALLTSIPLAYVLSRTRFRGKTLIEAFLLLPFALPPIALGTALLIFFSNSYLGRLVDQVIGIVFSVPGLIVAQYAVILPMVIRIIKTSFDSIDVRYEAVARTLGYGTLGVILRVMLPMSRRGLLTGFILGFTRAMGEFGASIMLAGATRFKTETIPIAIYLAMSSGELHLAVAIVVISVIVSYVALVAMMKIGEDRW
ncbi:MAG: ABC transporter permease subunit [Desulfurococcales archaeon]|nr:ABC transporter permease subunit [Desulfurococcales archaeon]